LRAEKCFASREFCTLLRPSLRHDVMGVPPDSSASTAKLSRDYGFKALPHDTFGLLRAGKAADRSYCFRDLMQSCKATQIMSEKIDSVQPRAAG
ncbi:MAG: hypothetical protein K2I66_01290, partial [Bacteroidales bacterium]|nr:hypothetical protein [Bacteroidales bacterium]